MGTYVMRFHKDVFQGSADMTGRRKTNVAMGGK